MTGRSNLRTSLAAAAAVAASPALAEPPTRIGTCATTTVTRIGTRFSDKLVKPKGDDPGEGTSFALANGVYGVSYGFIPEVAASRIGDRVITCLVSIPKGCPKGDDRGRFYTTTNLRTQESWTAADSQHMCGGA
ncbi:hypothetical protein [uncultured Methylobacterium sp.]|uniref:hypothetical protein n=1 Tax=uncultured Methylobacterium sp. TaxID=157278 RepID=UPI0035CA45F3